MVCVDQSPSTLSLSLALRVFAWEAELVTDFPRYFIILQKYIND